MWVNFKPGQNLEESSKGVPPTGLARQNSVKSNRSRNNSTSTNHLQKKIDEYSFKSNTEEWKRQQEYNERRAKRKLMKKEMKSQLKLQRVGKLHIPASILILVGIVLTLGACLRSISEGTFMWEYRETFRVAGPAVLGVGIILLMTAVALDGYIKEKYKIDAKPTVLPFLHPDFNLPKQTISRQSSSATTCELDDSFRPLIKVDSSRSRSKWYEFAHFNTTMRHEDSFWNSSVSSNTTSQDSQQSACKWTNAASFSISEESDNAFCEHSDSINQFVDQGNNSESNEKCNVNTLPKIIVCGCNLVPQANCRPKIVMGVNARDIAGNVVRQSSQVREYLVAQPGENGEYVVNQSDGSPGYLMSPSEDVIEQQYLEKCKVEDTTIV